MTKTTEKNWRALCKKGKGLYLYAGDQQTLIFREGRLNYDALGISYAADKAGEFCLSP